MKAVVAREFPDSLTSFFLESPIYLPINTELQVFFPKFYEYANDFWLFGVSFFTYILILTPYCFFVTSNNCIPFYSIALLKSMVVEFFLEFTSELRGDFDPILIVVENLVCSIGASWWNCWVVALLLDYGDILFLRN